MNIEISVVNRANQGCSGSKNVPNREANCETEAFSVKNSALVLEQLLSFCPLVNTHLSPGSLTNAREFFLTHCTVNIRFSDIDGT